MKTIYLVFLSLALASWCKAQNVIDINYADTATVLLNAKKLNGDVMMQDVTKLLGNPDRVVDYPGNEKSYFYDAAGFVVFAKNEKVKGFGINFNWDGDKKFPEKSFTGTFKIGGVLITKTTKSADLQTIQLIPFACPFDMLCASKPNKGKIQCTAAFKDNSMTQIAVLFR